jgi:SAM-dependent methyltransferase
MTTVFENRQVQGLAASPIAAAAQRFIDAAGALGDAPSATTLRAWCVPLVFGETERIFSSGAEPAQALRRMFEDVSVSLERIGTTGLARLGLPSAAFREPGDVRGTTGEHYGRLFEAFSGFSYWEEPLCLLRERLERNDLKLSGLERRIVLDAGCGGGRYTAAWRLLGAGHVVGVDASPIAIANAAARVRKAGLAGVQFHQGDVLALPFKDDTFDVVFSNGVLHHTTNWTAGIFEAVRVLRPGGLGWLYLIERPGGLFWDVIETLREALRRDGRNEARLALQQLGLAPNRIFYMLDHVMVPINFRAQPREVEESLAVAGAVKVRRLRRGTSFDRVERIAQGDPYSAEKYGVGENRYVFSKP